MPGCSTSSFLNEAVANLIVKQVLASQANRHFRHHRALRRGLKSIAELRVQEIVGRRWRVEGGELMLREGVQQAEAGGPVGVPVRAVDGPPRYPDRGKAPDPPGAFSFEGRNEWPSLQG